MNEELDKKLCEKYPKIFRNRNAPKQDSCMYWGFECGDGWYDILDNLCTSFQSSYTTSVKINEEFIALDAPEVIADQVKEKFGTLRFYYHLELPKLYTELYEKYKDTNHEEELLRWSNGYRLYFDGAVNLAEIFSSRTCEQTGKKGIYHSSSSGWVKVLNEDFAKIDPYCIERGFKPYIKEF